jgi:hypothetical protein
MPTPDLVTCKACGATINRRHLYRGHRFDCPAMEKAIQGIIDRANDKAKETS